MGIPRLCARSNGEASGCCSICTTLCPKYIWRNILEEMDPQSFVFTWPDVTQPAVLTIGGPGVDYIKSRIADLSTAIKDGVARLQNAVDFLESNPALNTESPGLPRTVCCHPVSLPVVHAPPKLGAR